MKAQLTLIAAAINLLLLSSSYSTTLSANQVASVAYGAGFRSSSLVYAVAISGAESSFVQEATNYNYNTDGSVASIDRGLWQVNSYWHPEYNASQLLSNASYNASAAYSISSSGTSWTQWSTYYAAGHYAISAYEGDGAYLSWLSTAIPAAFSVDSTVVHTTQDAVRAATSALKVRDNAGGNQQTQQRSINDTGVVTATYQTAKIGGSGKTWIWWKVRWSDGQEGWSAQDYLSRTGSSSGPPSAPVAAAATSVTSSSFQANWGASSGATGYYMDVSTNSSFSSYVFYNYDVGNYSGINVTPLSAGTTYYYRIRAYNGSGTSGNSNTITVTTSGIVPSAPVATAATFVASSSFQANWGAVSGAAGYRFDVSTSSSFTSYISQDYDAGNYTSVTEVGLSAGTTYYYRVRSYNGSGTSGNSNTITVSTSGAIPSAPVAMAATSVGSGGFQANWNVSTDATGYFIDLSTSSTFSIYLYNNYDMGNSSGAIFSGLSAGTSYYYRVRAYNGSGTSGNSGTISVSTTGGSPSAPVATGATFVASSSFQANWNASSGATGYYMDVSTSSSFSSYVFNNYDVGNYTGIAVTPLSAGTTYYYRIRAYNASGTSGNSSTITVTTSGIVPSAPVATAATFVASSSFQANWGAVSGATGYRIDVSTSSSFTSYITQNYDAGNYTSVTEVGLSAGTTYYYRVRSYNGSGTSGNSSTITVSTSGGAPSAPAAMVATSVGSSGFQANWNISTGATGYFIDLSTSSTFSIYLFNNYDMGNSTGAIFSGLSAGTSYYYRVRAYNGSGTSGNSGTISLTTTGGAPAAPTFTGVGGGPLQPPRNGQFQIEVHSDQAQMTIQASDDLVNWADAGIVTFVNGKAIFTDTNAGAHAKRFYRPKT